LFVHGWWPLLGRENSKPPSPEVLLVALKALPTPPEIILKPVLFSSTAVSSPNS